MKKVNIAIDGTSGSGKSTIAKMLSKHLSFYYLNTGAIYRLIAFKSIKEKIDSKNEKAICTLLKNLDIEIKFEKDKNGEVNQYNLLEGKELNKELRTEKISLNTSIIAQYQCVHNYIKKIILGLSKRFNIIVEGRDIGTFVLPKADFKFFITAKSENRAKRRLEQLGLPESEYEKILYELKERDKRDRERAVSPLKVADDAYIIDNSNQTPDETVQEILDYIKIK